MGHKKPKLIESIPVFIEQIDKSKTSYSSGPRGTRDTRNRVVRKKKFKIPAQVVFGDRDQKGRYIQLGKGETTKGYIVLLFKDLKKLGVDLKYGDKIVQMGKEVVELYISHSSGDPTAQFSDTGTFSVLRMFFHDREPKGG